MFVCLLVGWLVGLVCLFVWVGLGWVGLGWVWLGWVGLVGWLVVVVLFFGGTCFCDPTKLKATVRARVDICLLCFSRRRKPLPWN